MIRLKLMCRTISCLIGLLAVSVAAGCGGGHPKVGRVEGTVKLDGKPLPRAWITFSPVGKGSPSFGRTDENGWYELIYSRQEKGALPGEHAIVISTFVGEDNPEPPAPELVPARYNSQTELTRTVETGKNVIDFDLEPGGRIVQPDAHKRRLRGNNP